MTRNPPSSPLNYPANNTTPIRIFSFDRAPTTDDFRNFIVRDFWIDNESNDLYFLVDKEAQTGIWISLGGSGVLTETLTGNTGGAVGPDFANNINLLGSSPYTVTGDPGTNTLTIDDDGTLATTYTADSGTATPAAGNLNVFGNGGLFTSATGSTVTINSNSTAVSYNLGIAFSGSTFSITSSDGSPLSSSNRGFVRLPSKSSPGLSNWIPVTADQTFVDATGSSTIIGNLFGLTTGIVHAQEIPFFIYAVSNDSENDIAFMVSRYPKTLVSPVDTKIGQSGTAIADTVGSFFSLKAITATEYDSNPTCRIGSLRMAMDVNDDWTVQTLALGDGIGFFNETSRFIVALNQFGAVVDSYFIDNGGTAPETNLGGLAYETLGDLIILDWSLAITTGGVGAVALNMQMPYPSRLGLSTNAPNVVTSAAVAPLFIGTSNVGAGSDTMNYFGTNPTNIRQLLNTDVATGDNMFGRSIYPVNFS